LAPEDMKARWPFLVIAGVTVWVALSFVFMWPPILTVRQTGSAHACLNNLRQIDGAKKVWAHSAAKSDGDRVIVEEVNAFIKGGSPVCPDGGTYSYNSIGKLPSCSLGGTPPRRVRVGMLKWEWSHSKHHELESQRGANKASQDTALRADPER